MIIACDTSSSICSVALVHDGEVMYKEEAHGGQIHIEQLTPFLKLALDMAQASGNTLEALGIAIGPGSFNGLRIGLASMKALAQTQGLPLIPVPTTDALAYSARNNISGSCRAVIFSHRDFVHTADYTLEKNGTINTPDFKYSSWDHLFQDGVDHYFGTADRGFADWLAGESGQTVNSKFYNLEADAAQVALLAEIRSDEKVFNFDELEPFYNAEYAAKKWVPPSF